MSEPHQGKTLGQCHQALYSPWLSDSEGWWDCLLRWGWSQGLSSWPRAHGGLGYGRVRDWSMSTSVRTGMMASIYSRKLRHCLQWEGKSHISRPLTAAHSDFTREHMPAPFMVKKAVMYENLFIHIPPSVFWAWRSASRASVAGSNVMSPSELVNSSTLPLSVCKLPF